MALTPTENRARKIAQKLCNALNSMSFDYEMFAQIIVHEHETIQQNIFRVILALIKHWAQLDRNQYSVRSAETVRICQKIATALEADDFDVPHI